MGKVHRLLKIFDGIDQNNSLSSIRRRVFETREAVLEAAISLAHIIARKSPIAVQGSKINLNYARDHTIEDNFTFVVRRP